MRAGIVGTLALVLTVGVALTGCGEPDGGSASAATELSAAELGELGGRIYVEPGSADSLLAEREITREEFEVRIREVASRPEEARAYTEAFDAVVAESGGVPEAESVDGEAAEDESAGPDASSE